MTRQLHAHVHYIQTTMDTSQALRRCGDRIECWDDDPDFVDLDLKLMHTPTSSPKSPKSNIRLNFETHNRDRRESISSRMSIQSSICEFDSPDSWDHERQVLLDDSPAAAIASAINAGIPIPENVPSSALIGGTIKRLGTTKKARRIAAHDDWGEDLELPMSGMALKIREQERYEFPDSLQQILAGSRSRNTSPARGTLAPVLTASSQLNKFREVPDDDFFGDSDDPPTLKVSPSRHLLRQPRSTTSLLMTPPLSESATRGSPSVDDDFENDFEFPADAPLQLNIKLGDNSRGPTIQGLDNDFEEWAEGSSLGTRFGGTSRERGMSGGAMSIISPSVSSVTAESEDEAPLDGLEFPTGPLPNFQEILEKRKRASFSMDTEMIDAPPAVKPKASKEDFLEGIEIGDGEVFDARKLTLNRNVKHKQPTRKTSPVRRSAMSLTFTTNKSLSNSLSSGAGGMGNRLRHGHPTLAPPIPILEPVVERERENHNPTVSKRPENRNRWSNNSGTADRWSAKPEVIPPNIPPPPPIPHSRFFADRQRQMGSKQSLRTMKASNQQENTAPTTTNAQLLRMKRSMPNIGRAAASPSKPNNTVRSPSRNSGGRPASRSSAGRPPSSTGGRPPSSAGGRSTTTTTGRNESGRSGERKQAPFLPAGGTVRQSHHIAAKISQQTFEYKERIAAERRTNSRQQRTPHHSPSSSTASTKTKRGTPTIAPEPLRRQAAAIETLRQPTRKRNFGDGTELETFDDLPTSIKAENRFVVTPVGRRTPKAAKSQSVPIFRASDRDGESPKKKIDLSRDLSSRFAEVPRFARDTNGLPPPLFVSMRDFNSNSGDKNSLQECKRAKNRSLEYWCGLHGYKPMENTNYHPRQCKPKKPSEAATETATYKAHGKYQQSAQRYVHFIITRLLDPISLFRVSPVDL